MRGKCGLIIAGLFLMALPAVAQQSANDENGNGRETSGSAAMSSAIHVNSANWLALPEAPRPTPFPAATSGNAEAPGRLTPKFELAAGYSYVNFNPGDPFGSYGNHGASGAFAFNASRYLGLVAELNGYNFSRDINGNEVKAGWSTWLFRPRLNMRRFDYFVPFAEFLH